MIVNVLILIMLILVTGCSSAPKPPQVSLSGDVNPVNFQTASSRHAVIKSQQARGYWRKQFVYRIDNFNPSPEFFYTVAHADRIIANIKPPFIDFVFKKLQSDLRKYGIATPVELSVVADVEQPPQVILDCVKLGQEW